MAAIHDSNDTERAEGPNVQVHFVFADSKRSGAERQKTQSQEDTCSGKLSNVLRVGRLGRPDPIRGKGHRQEITCNHHDDHEQGRQNSLSGHQQTNGKEEELRDLLGCTDLRV